jgi:hypothetical protein
MSNDQTCNRLHAAADSAVWMTLLNKDRSLSIHRRTDSVFVPCSERAVHAPNNSVLQNTERLSTKGHCITGTRTNRAVCEIKALLFSNKNISSLPGVLCAS